LNEQFPDQRFGSSGRLNENTVARNDASRMFNKNFCKIFDAGISHKKLLGLPQRNRKPMAKLSVANDM
jgi:hypothetical protein